MPKIIYKRTGVQKRHEREAARARRRDPRVRASINERNRLWMNRRYRNDPAFRVQAIAKTAEYRKANPGKRKKWDRAYSQRNRERETQRNAEWVKKNRRHYLAIRKKYREANAANFTEYSLNRRARIKGSKTKPCASKIAQLKKTATRCYWCGCELNKENFSIDHVIPLARGGVHEPGNLEAACLSCNISKNQLLPEEWLPKLKRRLANAQNN